MARHLKDYNLLSLSAESRERVVNEFNDLDEVHAKFLYTYILKAVQKVVEDDKIDCLRNLSIVLTEISKTKNNECLQIYQHSDRKENFNLVSLACKNKAVKALNYIFSEKPQTLYNLSVKLTGVRRNELLFSVTDEFRHNAFYYAIRSNMTDLLNILVNKWQSQYSDEELDDLLSQSYKELKLRNVSLTIEMQLFVQSKILDLRFFHASAAGNTGTGNSWEQIKKRIEMVVKYIRSAKDDYWDRDPDDKFILIAEFIVKNIYVLKSLLKSTYDRLPWEEIEFCLTIFIRCCKSSSKQNLVYNCVLNKKQMLKHLFNFSLVLDTQHDKFENSNVMQLAKYVKLPRESVIDKIKENSSEFCELYDDFEKIRDFCSLEIIKSYADLLKSSDGQEKRRHLLVSRVLQVMGEHLKNTLDSPKLSTKTANVLLSSLSLETKDIITELRDALSHEETLFIRSEIEKKAYLFKNILTNILRIQDMISDMLCTMRIASVKILMNKVKLCESTEDIKECYGPCRHSLDLYSEEIKKTNLIKSDFDLFEELLQFLYKYINYNARGEKILYEQIHFLIQEEKQRLQNLKQEFHQKAAFVSYFNTYSSNENFNAIIRSKANPLADFPLEAPVKETKKIGELLKELFGIVALRVLPSENMELNYILFQYFNFMNSEMGSVKWIEELGKIVNQNKISVMCRNSKKNHTQKLSHNVSQNLLKSKFSQLKEALADFAFEDGTSTADFSSFESNKELQAVTEMLVLDILCLLENSCSRNPFFLDSDFPIIAGKNLRNHLAHRNTLIDVFLEESSAQLFVNAKKILTAETSKNYKKMDKIIKCDFIKLGTSIECDLRIISNQQKLFFALEKGNVKDAEVCVSEGADVYGRDCNLSTCLHFAGRAPDCAALEWVLRQALDINSKDSSGQTVFHTAAKFNRIEVIRYLVDRKQMSLDTNDENGKKLLHFPAKASDISALKWILKQELYINSNKSVGQIVSHIAAKFNSIEEKQYWVERKHMLLDIRDENGETPLDVAVENQSMSVVEYISKLEIHSSVKDNDRSTALLTAMYRHNKDTAKVLLEKGANIDEIKVHFNITVLHIAAESGNINLVKLLIAKKHKIDSRTEFGHTPLHLATFMKHFEIVKTLVVNGADVNVKDEDGITPLLAAASLGSLEIVDLLLQHGADIDVSDCRRLTPLIRAVVCGNASVTELLLEMGASVSSKEICGFTPLHFAAGMGHCEIVELLLNHNAIIDCKSDSNLTPLHVSASSGHKEVVELLIKEGAKINATQSTNSTPLHAAAAAGYVDIVDLLIVEGADINFKNETGSTALHLAASNADRAVVELLLKRGADIRAINANKDTPLYFLISNGLSDLLTLDFRDVNSSDANGCTLFHSAALAGDQTLVEYCIENRCDVKARDNFGSTALHLAAQGNHHKIVSLLLNKDADIDAKNDCGKTPLMLAILCNSTEVVEVLVSYKIEDFKSNMDDKIEALRLAAFFGNYKIIDILLQNYKFDNSNKNIQRLIIEAILKDNKHLVATFSERGFEINGDAKLLHFAANCSRHYMAELLLSKGANPNLLDENNLTPIEIAILKNDAEMVKILLSEKADIRMSSESILSAAETAIITDKLEIIKLLLQMKVIDANARRKSGFALLHIAAFCGKLDATKYLIAEGADINAKDEEGRAPVYLAAERGFEDMVEFYLNCNDLGKESGLLLIAAASHGKANVCELLLKRNYKVNACHVNEAIIIKLALVKDHKEVLFVLLHHGAYYNAHPLPQLDNGAASLLATVKKLFTAVRNNAPSEVETLLKEESNPKYCFANARCVKKETVLHYASWNGCKKIVDILLKYNANSNPRTNTGNAPLHYAAKYSYFSIVKALLSNGAIYNELSQTGKTPLDYATDREIRDFFLFLNTIFTKVQDNDLSVLEDLREKDEGVMRSVIRAKNQKGKTLIEVAHISGFPETDELEMLFEKDLVPKLESAEKLLLERKFLEAILAFDNIFSKSVAIFGEDSEPVLRVREYIGQISENQGNLNKALHLYREVHEIRKNKLGEDHLKALSVHTHIAALLTNQGKTEEALQIFERVHIKLKEKLEPDDMNMILFKVNFSSLLFLMKKFDEVLKINVEIQQNCAQKREDIYRTTLVDSLCHTALTLTEQNKLFEALKLFVTVYETRKDMFTLHNLETLKALWMVAEILAKLGLFDESLKMFEEVLDIQKSFMPENHFDILRNKFLVGKTFFEQGMPVTALKIILSLKPKIAVLAPDSNLMKAIIDILEDIKNSLSASNDPFLFDAIQNKIREED